MTESPRTRHLGWGRLFDGGRLVPAFAIIAVASLVLGVALAHFIQPPAVAPAHGVTAGFITAPVVRTTLRNQVVARADASFADAVKIGAPPETTGSAIVTGTLPSVGDHESALSVVAEVSGRPIILLPGSIPAYRTLSFGLTGSDVIQLKRALASAGIDPGNENSDVYDAKTAAAVGVLYQRVGYAPAGADPGSSDQVRSAQDAVTGAQDSLNSANRALATAQNAPTSQSQLEQNNLVASAQRAEQSAGRGLTSAQSTQAAANATEAQAQATNTVAQQILANSPGDPAARANAAAAQTALSTALSQQTAAANGEADAADALANAQDATALAVANRAAALATPNTGDQSAAVISAQHGLQSAEAALTAATDESLPILPAGEVAFVTQLPRRVDSVTATIGAPATGTLMTLSGADLALTASVSSADAALLAIGAHASFEPANGGGSISAHVTSIEVAAASTSTTGAPTAQSGGSDNQSTGNVSTSGARMSVTLAPEGLSDAQVKTLDGSNVRLTIPVGATTGAVLAVPIAAVSLGPGGESRVQVVGRGGRASFVVVTTGLVAQGDVEVRSTSGTLKVGDKVVVGK